MSRIKERISTLVKEQLPDFVEENYSTYLSFVEFYYKFLEQDQNAFELIQNAKKYNDIDQTAESFVQYFLKNYTRDIPESALVNKKLLIKRIKDLYESKGSEISFKLLFRILYNESISINYPYDSVLRASDGKWSQRTTLRLRTVSGDKNDIKFRNLTYSIGGIQYNTSIEDVIFRTNEITEVVLDADSLAPSYTLGDTVTVVSNDTTIFTGTIDPTTVSATVSNGGLGFKKGKIYTVNFAGGVGSQIQISNVSSTGAVQEVKFINFGYGFDSSSGTVFPVTFDPNKNVSNTAANQFTVTDSTGGFSSNVSLAVSNADSIARYFETNDYLDNNTYTQTSETVYSNDDENNQLVSIPDETELPESFATINFSLGTLSRYPGSFSTNKGFLSEPDVRLQDDKLYQPFAYQTKTQIDYNKFFNVVKKLVHPAGQNLFNDRSLTSNVDLSATFGTFSVVPTSNIFFEALSTFGTSDNVSVIKAATLTFSDSVSVDDPTFTFGDAYIFSDTTGTVDRFTAPAVNQTFTVTVQNVDGDNKYFIDGVQQDELNLYQGYTYTFDWSAATSHPVRFSTTPDGTHGGGSEFTDGVTIDGVSYTSTIVIPANTPTLYYYCLYHSGMGGTINHKISGLLSNINILEFNPVDDYFLQAYSNGYTTSATLSSASEKVSTTDNVVINIS